MRRATALLLSLLLAALAIHTWRTNPHDHSLLILLFTGVLLGLLYAALGALPSWLLHITGNKLTSDDDPQNLSPRLYLPILAAAIALAALLYYLFAPPHRH